jgi:hypothetical protein
MALNNCSINQVELEKTTGQPIGNNVPRLIITPNTGYVVSASSFSNNSGSIPGVTSITLSDSATPGTIGNLVYVDINLDDSFIMPSSDTNITIDIDGSASLEPISINGTYTTTLTNCSTSGQNNIPYSASGAYNQVVQVFTKTIAAANNHYFKTAPVYSIDSGTVSNYIVTYIDVLDGSNRLISREFIVSYKLKSNSEFSNYITFTAVAEEIYVVPIEITAYAYSTSSIPTSGDTRLMTVFGTPTAEFSVTIVDQDDTELISVLNQAIPSNGYYDISIAFPSATINKTYTITLTGDLSATFNTPSGQPSVFTIDQHQDITIGVTATHSDSSVTIDASNNTKSFPANTTINEIDGSFVANFVISSTNTITLASQPDVNDFTNTDFDLNGGSDFLIKVATLSNGTAPNTFDLVVSVSVLRSGDSNVTSSIDISSLINVSTSPAYCPLFSEFTPNLGSSTAMSLIYSNIWATPSITYNGTEPATVTLKWYASGQSSYPGFPESTPPYSNAYSTQLNLTPGGSFTLTSGYINSAETNISLNAAAFTCEYE